MSDNEPVDYPCQRALLGPAWRWQLALTFLRGGAPGPDAEEPQLQDAVAYLRLGAEEPLGKERAALQYPWIETALQLAHNPEQAASLKVLVLGRCSVPEIAARLTLAPQAVVSWESLFFDVRPAQEATDWIFLHVIQSERQRGHQALAAELQLAWVGGAPVAQALVDGKTRLPQKQGEMLFERKLRWARQLAHVLALPITNPGQQLAFLALSLKLAHQEQCLQRAERQFQYKCQQALQRQAAQTAVRQGRQTDLHERPRRQTRLRELEGLAQARREPQHPAQKCATASALAQLRWKDSHSSCEPQKPDACSLPPSQPTEAGSTRPPSPLPSSIAPSREAENTGSGTEPAARMPMRPSAGCKLGSP